MHSFKVFTQTSDHSFVEVAQLTLYTDASTVFENYPSGMITKDGAIIKTKNLKSDDTPALFKI